MTKDPNHLTGFETENTGGLLSGFLAEEDELDRRSMWRLGSWGVASMGAVILALYVNQSSIGLRRDQLAAADLARQSQQIQLVAKESQNEARRLTAAIDTLNGDRDRLYSRLTVLEQGLDSVTGAIARQKSAAASPQAVLPSSTPPSPAVPPSSMPAASTIASSTPPAASPPSTTPVASPPEPSPMAQNPPPPPVASPVMTTPAKTAEKPTTSAPLESRPAAASSLAQAASPPLPAPPATSLMPSKSIMAPPDPAATKLIEPEKPASAGSATPAAEMVASVAPVENADADGLPATTPKLALQRTEFGVDVGGANSVGGLRALWRGLLKSKSNAPLAALHPIIVVKESNTGLGMQLRLVAGPLNDAAAAAKICAAMIESERTCETTVFDGQRLAMNAEESPASATKPVPSKSAVVKPARRRSFARRVANDQPVVKPDPPTTLSSFLGLR
jgi:hypothetical protein